MDIVREDRQYRVVPDDGHILLLLESQKDQRTFSDYPNLITCLDTILSLYEQTRQPGSQYVIQEIWNWIDEFYRLEVFIFDQEISRYKKLSRTELKNLFIDQIKKLGDDGSNENSQ